MKGRAEYENIEEKELFEEKSPLSLYPWAREGTGTGMIIAERGMGKTFFSKKLGKEIPTTIYELNKKTLEYELMQESSNPRVIVLDDLHYLLQAMRLGMLKNRKTRDEEEVLQILKNFKNEVEEAEAKPIFIADEGPGGLYYNFQEEKNKREFLKFLEGCVTAADDNTIFYRYLGRCFTAADNVFNFRSHITDEMSTRIRREYGMKDVPLVAPSEVVVPSGLYGTISYYKRELKKLERYHGGEGLKRKIENYKQKLNKIKMELFLKLWELSKYKFIVSPYEPEKIISERGVIWTPSKSEYDELSGQKLIAPIREFKVLHEELGDISRKSLRIPFGIKRRGSRTAIYSLDDVWQIQEIVDQKYSEIAGRETTPFAKKLLDARTENEFSAAFVEHELSKE